MRRSFLSFFPLAFLALLIDASSARGDCYPSTMGNSKNNFPDSVSPETVYKVTGLRPDTCGVAMAKWPHGEGLFVVYSEDASHYSLQLLKQEGATFKVTASYRSELGEYRFNGFDLAAYKLKKDKTAIGVRFFARGPTKGGEWKCIRLRLFEQTNSELNPILSTTVSYEAEGNEVAYDFDTAFSESTSAIVVVGKPDKSGYNRLTIKGTDGKHVLRYQNGGGYSADQESDCLGAEHCWCP